MQRPQAHLIKVLDQATDPKVGLLIQARADRPIEVKVDRDAGIE